MDRIKNVMQRFIDVYQGKHPKTAIDIDLMLDYTRVIYADLLEWRKSFKDQPEEVPQEVKNAETISQPPMPDPVQETVTAERVERAEEQPPSTQEVSSRETPAATETEAIPLAEEKEEEQHHVLAGKEEPVWEPATEIAPVAAELSDIAIAEEAPENTPVSDLNKSTSGISFEPPAIARTSPEPAAKGTPPEEQVMQHPVAETEKVRTPSPSGLPGSLFSLPETKKDIRAAIGINDKYLFLNELFNNNKEEYEGALQHLNRLRDLDEALSWVGQEVASTYKWDKNDSTVETFYTLLGKHFSSR